MIRPHRAAAEYLGLIAFAGLLPAAHGAGPVKVVLNDGREAEGPWEAVREGSIALEGAPEAFPLHEVSAILLHEAGPAEAMDDGPVLFFRDGERLAARVTGAAGALITVEVVSKPDAPGAPPPAAVTLRLPAEIIAGFRLREAYKEDDLFETDLAAARGPDTTARRSLDAVYVRSAARLLRVEGTLRSLGPEYLSMEIGGEARRIRRQLVLGALLAPIASRAVDGDVPAVVELRSGGQFPAALAGLRVESGRRDVLLRFRGLDEAPQPVPLERIARIRFASDRIAFLSSLAPVRVEEVPLLGSSHPFPWRKDLAASGAPLAMAGRSYRKGLGVHPRTVLEYDIAGAYRTFAAVIGLDASAGKDAAVTFRVAADGKELLRKDMAQGQPPEAIALPLTGVKRLALELDFGPDGVDLGDHADWADARVAK